MGQRAAAGTGSQGRALARAAGLCLGRPLAFALLLASLAVSQPCRADDPVRGEATFTSGGGFARLVLKLAEDVELPFRRRVRSSSSTSSARWIFPSTNCRTPFPIMSARRARPRRHGDPAVAGAAGNRQHHDGGGTDLHRLPAR